MNSYDYEERLREVIYLHSLWHQGPPQGPQHPSPFPRPEPARQYPSRFPPVRNPTIFRNRGQNKKAKTIEDTAGSDKGKEWPVKSPPPQAPLTASGWPEMKSLFGTHNRPALEECSVRPSPAQMQKKIGEACREFFAKSVSSDSEEESDLDEVGDEDLFNEDDDDDVVVEESEEYKFLLDLFVKDSELRVYYERNYENGEFRCLVCCGMRENMNKWYKNCTGLVLHAMNISRTKRRMTHRAFGHVVCRVIGWDIHRLPLFVLNGEPLGRSLLNSGESQGGGEGRVDGDKDILNACQDNVGSENGNNSGLGKEKVNDESMICKNSSRETDGSRLTEHLVDNPVRDVAVDKDGAWDGVGSEELLSRGVGWPCKEPTHSSGTMEWPPFKPQKALVTNVISAEEQVRFTGVQLQRKILKACQNFFADTVDSESCEGDDEDEDEDECEECEYCKFFLKVFTEDNELRDYYENNYGDGEFYCLVCGGIGKKVWKKFKGCLGLLQHATAISKTNKKRAHRAFGQVVSKVLGWDVDRIPNVVLTGQPLCSLLQSNDELKGNRSNVVNIEVSCESTVCTELSRESSN
ncbi:hypothetical protein HS088_TW21G00432 [Tripterygium wilfordii]|uniref:Uncharacterized protein n=1 Tax=Tripterygium wilfordii TaxID=458696 RepID=A0A7J7C349_TRIWF|nr:uncharacterized protein LOC119989628 [Tripterygium wilfordii]KAF5728287.1 hypothetical protein HS088_TW21G00432 [Tripterygium wilfordii]